MGKRYYEVEFGVWVEEPDPLTKPSCRAVWPDDWNHQNGPRPDCYRPEGPEGEHRAIRQLADETGWIEYTWTDESGSGRYERREEDQHEEK